jgi:polygalacturonase
MNMKKISADFAAKHIRSKNYGLHVINRLLFLVFLIFCFRSLAEPSSQKYNIKDFGAVSDSVTVNTLSIQKAIDSCSENGGGTVLIPDGVFVSGTILIKDNVTLFLDKGAILMGSTDISDYQLVDPFLTGNNAPMGYCFIGAVDAENVGITGRGIIDGRGKLVRESGGHGRRPFLIRIVRCNGVMVKGVHLINSTAWTSHFFASRNIVIDSISIYSRGLGNNDGINIDSSQDVKITNCQTDTGDDGLCFKTTWSKMACKNIEVKNMRITSNHAGIKFGTESMAPFENIKISDIYIYDTHNGGIKINSVDGAQIRNVEISNVVMDNVRTPMLFRLGSRLNVFRKDQDTRQKTGTIEHITIRNVKAIAAADAQLKPPSGILITGVPGHNIRNLTLENIEIDLPGGGTLENSRHEVPEAVDAYPEIRTFGPTIPAYGIWARHVEGLKMKNIVFNLSGPDLRPALIVQDGKDIEFIDSKVPVFSGAESVVRLENVSGAKVMGIKAEGDALSFVRTEGRESKNIEVKNNYLKGMKEETTNE